MGLKKRGRGEGYWSPSPQKLGKTTDLIDIIEKGDKLSPPLPVLRGENETDGDSPCCGSFTMILPSRTFSFRFEVASHHFLTVGAAA